ncbi:hypothetical protein GCM10010328_30000 [Streptomyces rubiginosohelvolus]|uniref:Uncharacterized protein n=1 Tax=Streptomyces rubiginosohelvolus TaxID=67362 RepID=A0ABQ3BP94_9ACTN|nr:hypothetical protein GCM10010328_30000 [Streptomyces pluricolorescens]
MFGKDSSPPRKLRKGSVCRATESELAALGIDPASNAAAAAAVRLAKELDSARDAKEVAPAARELRQAMTVVRAMAPVQERGDKVDELLARRAARGA